MKGSTMFAKVKFRWNDNPSGTPLPDRRLWVETSDGEQFLLTFAKLDAVVGEAERKMLARTAIRRGAGNWREAKPVEILQMV